MNGRRQEALTIHMAREHAATPHRNTGEKGERGKKQEAAQHTKETNYKREKHRHGPHTGRQLHTSPLTQTPSQCRQSAEEKIRPSTQQTHTKRAITQSAARRSDPSPIHDAAPHSTRSHGVRHFLRTYPSSIP
ncbi:hypothetical protein TcCL_Unassigned00491 [Trypanosoma cruzi]|nr:hypothetical protein TcCL_Unassigned00491 [Trypanosoma cruzi]